jgi:hypothetical protein
VRWFLFGAQAAIVHGAARLTNDVDVTVELGERSTLALVSALEEAGFVLRVRDVADFVERTRVLPVRHRRSGIDLDVVLAGPGPEQLFLRRAVRRTIEAVSVPVACAEDLIAMKILAARPKDMGDVAEIIAAQGRKLRLQRIRKTLRSLETSLGQSDLLPAFEATIERVLGTPPPTQVARRPRRSHPPPGSRRRR